MNIKKIEQTPPPEKIGPYKVFKRIGIGGMGEVFLAKDPICGRNVALKQIRSDLRKNQAIRDRFLREAKIASLLTHPSIVPIYAIHKEEGQIYYTMPFVEGKTLKELLLIAKKEEMKTAPSVDASIPYLSQIFLRICEAIAYAHDQNIIHRDIKPENVLLGKYGEVMIFDWGIADFAGKESDDADSSPSSIEETIFMEDLTKPGKIAGTLAFMAPERAIGKPSSFLTDIYALGVILYQILTLRLPFRRGNLKTFRKMIEQERLIDPTELAPYREIPQQLAEIAKKCLARSEADRYQTMEELITDLKNYIEGKSDWVLVEELDVEKKSDWEFQESVSLAKHIAISSPLDIMEWFFLMISKPSFRGNVKLQTEFRLEPGSSGIGFLLCVPEPKRRKNLEEGYLVWIGNTCQLYRNNVLVSDSALNVSLENTWHSIRIEKLADLLQIYIDDQLILSHMSHLPLRGEHIGILHKDVDFEMKLLQVYASSHNVQINCIALPDAFFTHKDYETALQEYRRIGLCFPGRAEGREARFRAGLTLLEQAKAQKTKQAKSEYFSKALDEFEKLHGTAGAPLEYLGKSFVYGATSEYEEEAKCLELTLRKFANHPLLPIVEEHLIYRLHDCSLQNREATYRLLLLILRHLPTFVRNPEITHLIDSIEKNMDVPLFFENHTKQEFDPYLALSIKLAFFVQKPQTIVEIVEFLIQAKSHDLTSIENALYCLMELRAVGAIRKLLGILPFKLPLIDAITHPDFNHEKFIQALDALPRTITKKELRWILAALRSGFSTIPNIKVQPKDQFIFDSFCLQKFLIEKEVEKAEQIFKTYTKEQLATTSSPLFHLYGCFLFLKKESKKALAHLKNFPESSFPPTSLLLSHFLFGKIDTKKSWFNQAFFWEKKALFEQLIVYYSCVDEPDKKKNAQEKLRQCREKYLQ